MSSKALVRAAIAAPVVTGQRDQRVEPLRRASLALAAASLALLFVLSVGTGVVLDPDGSTPLACLLAVLLLISAVLTRTGRIPRIADFFGTLAVTWLGALSGGAIAMVGLHLHQPIADPFLHAADLALGINGVGIVDTMVGQGQWLFSLMAPAYAYTIPLLALAMAGLALLGQRAEAWRAAFCFNGTLLTASLITAMLPAKGLGVWLPERLLSRLPNGAVTYAFDTFEAFYSGGTPQLGINAIDGVITFPSFHMIMGLIVLAMMRHHLILLFPAGAWFSLMVLSTLPFGGHYGVDLLGGVAVWAMWFGISRLLEAGARGQRALLVAALKDEPCVT